ncbi:GNAT family N-acetyltransferase [Corynebacterium lubricantis]|uniref:GNAT family N-acetyltransferase n=1 Tax=Corynebacterium lubricantis TaxID=541095 RepID=UPI00035DCA2D|nr:GNAT family N-acetyltransferase [Corynebacterium lubricantis]
MELSQPAVEFHQSFLEVWQGEDIGEGHGMSLDLAEGLDLNQPRDFAQWVRKLIDEERTPQPGRVPSTNLWMTEDSTYLGSIQLRHNLGTEYLRTRGGHVGYTVRSSSRGQGLATAALMQLLPLARERGLEKLLVTCLEANPASARVIEKAGGVYEMTTGGLRRYWVSL